MRENGAFNYGDSWKWITYFFVYIFDLKNHDLKKFICGKEMHNDDSGSNTYITVK